MSVQRYNHAAQIIKDRLQGDVPKIALTLGSGLNDIAAALTDFVRIPYSDIPGFPPPTVDGHCGQMIIGSLGGIPLLCLQGRAHVYEGHDLESVIFSVRTLWALGIETLILTNAAGSLRPEVGPGALMAITDHINLSGVNPLIGPNINEIGTRFTDMTHAWDPRLTALLKDAAIEQNISLSTGVYLMVTGPNFETPAEINAFRTMGADAVGMSTVPECLAARHAGINVVGISSITNLAAGMTKDALTHTETMKFGALAGKSLSKVLSAFVKKL